MHATTVAVDLAKSVFQLAVADEHWRVVETQRLTRSQFERWFVKLAQGAGKEIQGVRRWALEVQGRSNHNKATCALANKLARICYATLRDHKPFDEAARVNRKERRQSFAMPD
jgi:hypothetical protein